MIRDRRCGPILIIPLALAIGCGSSASSPLVVGGANGGGGTGGVAGGGSGATGGDPVGAGGASADGGMAGATGGDGMAGGSGGDGSAGTTGGDGLAGVSGRGGAAGTAGTGGGPGTGGGGGALGGSAAAGSSAGGAAGASGGNAPGASGGNAAGSSGGSAGGTSGGGAPGGSGGGAPSSRYRLSCDGSMAVMIDADHFLDGNDEQQGMRLYTRGVTGTPLATIDVSVGIGLSTGDEADFEDAARVGDRIYVIGSHGRNKSGKLDRARYHFFAMDLSGTVPAIALSVPGYTTMLLDQMLLEENWITPDAAVIATLTASSSLGRATDPLLPPLAAGTNIEGLAWLPTATRPQQLLIGFRNPLQAGKAIVVSLLNPDAVVAGATALFGEATLIDLGGLGIRSMAWSAVHGAVLLIAGPQTDAAGPFKLFKWSGAAGDPPIAVADITGVPSASAPEAIVVYPNSRDVQIVFDEGDHVIGASICKDAADADQAFGDVIVNVP